MFIDGNPSKRVMNLYFSLCSNTNQIKISFLYSYLMKLLIFLGLIVALSAVRLATHDYEDYEWVEPSGECGDHLAQSITNKDGKFVKD